MSLLTLFLLVTTAEAFSVHRGGFSPSRRTGSYSYETPMSIAGVRVSGASSTIILQSAVITSQSSTKNETTVLATPHQSASASSPDTKKNCDNSIDLNQQLNALAEQAGAATSLNAALGAAVQAEQLWKTGEFTDLISFNTVLKAWSRTCQTLAELHGRPTTVIMDDVLPKKHSNVDAPAITVDIGSVNIYTARDAAIHAENLLKAQLELAAKDGADDVIPDTASFNSVMDAWAKSRDVSAPDQVEQLLDQLKDVTKLQPDTYSYNAVVDAYAYSNRPDRLERLHKLWDEMKTIKSAHPSVRTINSILHAYSKAGLQDPEKAEKLAVTVLQIFQEMKQTYTRSTNPADQPDVVTYTTIMECLARCGTLQSAEQAEELFTELKEYYRETENERFKPSIYTYTTLIKTWSRTYDAKAPERSEELLEELLARTDGVKPNSMVFTAVIQCWSRSRDNRKAAKSLKLLQRMRALAADTNSPVVAPSLMSYNSAIDACARTRGNAVEQTAALKIAFAILKAIELQPANSFVKVNHVTFATLLKGVGFLLPPGEERNKIAQAVFEKAVAASQVEITVIKSLQKACDASVLQALLLTEMQGSKAGHFDYDRIPTKWSRNVRT